jgi:hypothetical protein
MAEGRQHSAAVQSFPSDVYRFPSLAEMVTALATAGFSIDAGETTGDENAGPVLLVAERVGLRS